MKLTIFCYEIDHFFAENIQFNDIFRIVNWMLIQMKKKSYRIAHR